jgi:hypothetical protein
MARRVVGMVAPPMESDELHVANRVRGSLDTYLREGEDVADDHECAHAYLRREEEASRRWHDHRREHNESEGGVAEPTGARYMATSSPRRDRPQWYTARLEVHLDQATQTTITRFVTAFRRRQSVVLRHVLDWGLSHGQGWTIDRGRPPGRAQRVSLRLEPERRERVEAAATTAGGDISAWLCYAMQRVTVADFPASWQAASAEQQRAPQRSQDSRQYGTRFMLRLDDASLGKLDAFTVFFVTSRAAVIRQRIIEATPKMFPQSWHMAAAERQQQQARQADTRLGRR